MNELTLMDVFAAAALTGLLAHPGVPGSPQWSPREAAEQAYEIADAMLSERKIAHEQPEKQP